MYEGSDVQLSCSLRDNYLPVGEIIWFNNHGQDVGDTPKYTLRRTSAWANLTVRDTDETQDSGEYRCSSSNAVGGTEVNVTLIVKSKNPLPKKKSGVVVKLLVGLCEVYVCSAGHPMPPNATLVSVTYNSRKRNEVELEWQIESEATAGWTGFILEHRWVPEQPGRRSSSNDSQAMERIAPPLWTHHVIQDPDVRTHTVGSLTPTATYQFRITPLNHRTAGHPSAARSPGTGSEQRGE